MSIYSNTVSITQYTISGDLPKQDQFQWFSQKLAARGFQSIENSSEEVSEGWTLVDRSDDADFAAPADFWRDNYLVFSLRRDQRKIPAALLKSHAGREEAAFLSQYPNLRRAPKKKREEIKEQVQLRLLTRCLPVPSTVDVVWDQKNGVLSLLSLSSKSLERFEDIFRKTFEGLSLVAIHPFARARTLLEGQMLEKLEAAPAGYDLIVTDYAMPLMSGGEMLDHARRIRADVVGPVCESGDFLALNRDLAEPASGALLAVMSAGAYGAVQAGTYNTRPLVPEVLVNAEQWAVVRPRLEVDQLIALDRMPDWL